MNIYVDVQQGVASYTVLSRIPMGYIFKGKLALHGINHLGSYVGVSWYGLRLVVWIKIGWYVGVVRFG